MASVQPGAALTWVSPGSQSAARSPCSWAFWRRGVYLPAPPTPNRCDAAAGWDQLYDVASNQIQPALESVPGVGQVSISGGLQREIEIQVDYTKLAAYGVTVQQIATALTNANVSVPSGSVPVGTQTINIVPTPIEYWICTTFKRERMYRSWFMETNGGPLLKSYETLAAKFPLGLADVPELPEELSGAVNAAATKTVAR